MAKAPTTRTGTKRRLPYWNEEKARGLLRAAAAAKLSLPAFAEREGLPLSRLTRWQGRLETGAQPPVFREVTPITPMAQRKAANLEITSVEQRQAASLEIVLAGGRVVRVPAGFDDESLRRLLAVLESDAC